MSHVAKNCEIVYFIKKKTIKLYLKHVSYMFFQARFQVPRRIQHFS